MWSYEANFLNGQFFLFLDLGTIQPLSLDWEKKAEWNSIKKVESVKIDFFDYKDADISSLGKE